MHDLHLDICNDDGCFSAAVDAAIDCSYDTTCACFDYKHLGVRNIKFLQTTGASSIEEACKRIVKAILEHECMYWFESIQPEMIKTIDISMLNTMEELAVHLDLRSQEV